MTVHPNKLLIMLPLFEPCDYQLRLQAIDDALVVHRRVDGEFLLELRPMVTLTVTGTSSYAAALVRLARDLEAGHMVTMVERDHFLAELKTLAFESTAAAARPAVEHAALVIAERAFQISDHLDTDDREYRVNRMLVAARRRRTEPYRNERHGPMCMFGIPTPRAEQLWHTMRHEWCDPRANQRGQSAWERWIRHKRPDMPRRAADLDVA